MAVAGTWIAANAAAIGAGASAVGAATGAYGLVKANNDASYAERARANAEATASRNANGRIALQRQAMRDNNLLTGPPNGRDTLGVG